MFKSASKLVDRYNNDCGLYFLNLVFLTSGYPFLKSLLAQLKIELRVPGRTLYNEVFN